MTKKESIIVLIISLLTPYILIIFYLRTITLFVLWPIFIIALFLAILSLVSYIRIEKSRKNKTIVYLIFTTALLFFFLGYGLLLNLSDWVFFKIREDKLNRFVEEIISYQKSFKLKEGQSVSVNGQSSKLRSNMYIDPDVYKNIDMQLNKLGLISVDILENGAVSFTITGFMDNCVGLAFSKLKKKVPPSCGELIFWRQLSENWFVWYES
ncbi:MAG: hypothetical protein KDD94_10680 [Calditrichaeota bacterium]|nr:hypothetical protein [Calditrichota bacterium]